MWRMNMERAELDGRCEKEVTTKMECGVCSATSHGQRKALEHMTFSLSGRFE